MNFSRIKRIAVFLLFLIGIISFFKIASLIFHFRLVQIAPLYMLVPFGAVFLTRIFYSFSFSDLSPTFFTGEKLLLGIFLPIAIILISFCISMLLPSVHFSTSFEGIIPYGGNPFLFRNTATAHNQYWLFLVFILQAIILGITINAFFAFFEEIAWRGFLFIELNKIGFLGCAIVTGIIWGAWHAPIILEGYNFPQHPLIGVFIMIFACIFLSIFLNYLRIRSNSLLIPSFFHGVLNGAAWLPLAFQYGGSDLTVGVTSISGIFAMLLMALPLVLIYYRNR
jgi:membrane protease YdiL (CAAX protease family)